jgi:hypothetical protein
MNEQERRQFHVPFLDSSWSSHDFGGNTQQADTAAAGYQTYQRSYDHSQPKTFGKID